MSFVLTNNKRWFDQVRSHVAGGVHDYNLEERSKNEARIQESACLAEREREQEMKIVGGKSASYFEREERRRTKKQGITSNLVIVEDPSRRSIDSCYEAFRINAVQAKPSGIIKKNGKGSFDGKAKRDEV